MTQALPDDRLAKRNVAVLVAAQAVLGGQLPMMFVVAGLAGGMLTGNPCFATLPISLIVFGSMITAPWLAPLMQRYGRKTGFFIGALAWGIGCSRFGLWALCLFLCDIPSWVIAIRHLHVCAGVLPICRNRHSLGQFPPEGHFLGYGRRVDLSYIWPAAE
jgi:hypothetical protein